MRLRLRTLRGGLRVSGTCLGCLFGGCQAPGWMPEWGGFEGEGGKAGESRMGLPPIVSIAICSYRSLIGMSVATSMKLDLFVITYSEDHHGLYIASIALRLQRS